MAFEMMRVNNELVKKYAAGEIMKCNDVTAGYGLSLNSQQAMELVETRSASLRETGRVELGAGAIEELIKVFCDSPFISPASYGETLSELVEIFYTYKGEMPERMSDEELITLMKKRFDGVCKGSLELLAGRELERVARIMKQGHAVTDEGNWRETEQECESDEY